jgi:hypothetical protein
MSGHSHHLHDFFVLVAVAVYEELDEGAECIFILFFFQNIRLRERLISATPTRSSGGTGIVHFGVLRVLGLRSLLLLFLFSLKIDCLACVALPPLQILNTAVFRHCTYNSFH